MLYTIRLTDEDTASLLLLLGAGMGTLSKEGASMSRETKLAIDRFLVQVGARPYWHEQSDPILRPKGEG